MPADNPSHILRLLDAKLDHTVELTLIGKSALWLGFDDAPAHFGKTLDVDGLVPTAQSAAFDADMGFWDAMSRAVVPDDPEIHELFERAKPLVLAQAPS